jgi:peptide/nickel transport system substrate-binding protein
MRRKTRNKNLIFLPLALLLLLTGCAAPKNAAAVPDSAPLPSPTPFGLTQSADKPHTDSVFTLNYSPSSPLNPYTTLNKDNLLLTGLIYEPLFKVTKDFSFEPVLVSDWELKDGYYRFTIKSGVKFHNGAEITAWDMLYSVNTARSSDRYRSRLSVISSAWVDNGKLCISLYREDTDFPVLLDIPVIQDGCGYLDTPAGTGPYYLSGDNTASFLKAFEGYRAYEKLPLQRIYLAEYSPEESVTAYEEGMLDLAVMNPYEPSEPEYHGSSEVRRLDTTDLHYLGVNGESPFFDTHKRRRLVSSVIDREELAADIIGGTPAYLPVSTASKYYDEDIASAGVYKDIPAAKIDSLTEDYDGDGILEYLDGESRELTLNFIACNEDYPKLTSARRVADDLRKAGFDVNFRELNRKAFFDALYLGDFDLYYGEIWLRADFDLSQLLSPGGECSYGLTDNTITGLIQAFLAADGEDKTAAARALFSHIAETCPIIPLAFEQTHLLTHRGVVTGLNPTWQNPFNDITAWTVDLNR